MGRKCQGLVSLKYVQPPFAKVQEPVRHLFSTMTAQMQRICAKRPKTNHLSPSLSPEPTPVPSPSPAPEHAPAQVPKPSPSRSSPLRISSVKSVPKESHSKASKGDKVCALFTHCLRSGDKGYLHWGMVLAVKGCECTIKWQTDKKPRSHSTTDVFAAEAAAWAAVNSIASSGSASEAPSYPEPDPEATDPHTSPRSAEVGGASPAQKATQPGTSALEKFFSGTTQ